MVAPIKVQSNCISSAILQSVAELVKRDRQAARRTHTEMRLVEAATELFVERGYAATTLADVAEHAGLAPRTLYLRFPTKADLLQRCVGVAIAGDGPEEASLRRQVEALGLSGHVTFMGLRADGQQIIGALDVMVLPSFSEGMPNVLLEAFAYGTPVVATRVGGVPDMVSDGRSGWLVSAGDAVQLAAALIEALENRVEAQRRAAQARKLLAEIFTIEKQAHAWLRAVDAAVEVRSTPRAGSTGSH